jgi:hypothetical protein
LHHRVRHGLEFERHRGDDAQQAEAPGCRRQLRRVVHQLHFAAGVDELDRDNEIVEGAMRAAGAVADGGVTAAEGDLHDDRVDR